MVWKLYTGNNNGPLFTFSVCFSSCGEENNGSKSHTPRTSRVSVLSERAPLLASTALGYYKLHTRKPLHSTGPTKQLLSSFTFIPNLSVHKGAVFKCQISYKGKDKIVMERVSEKFTVLCKEATYDILDFFSFQQKKLFLILFFFYVVFIYTFSCYYFFNVCITVH